MINKDELKKLLKNEVNQIMDDWINFINDDAINEIVNDQEVFNKINDKYDLNLLLDRKELARCIVNLSCETYTQFYNEIHYQEHYYLKFKKIVLKEV